MAQTTPDIYKDYADSGGDLDYKTFAAICERYNQMIMEDLILEGGAFNMGYHLSRIFIGRLERNFDNPQVDWKASNELKQQIIDEGGTPRSKENPDGEDWIVYFTDDWYCKFHWEKSRCTIPNKTVYQFRPTRGARGNKRKLKDLLRSDELAHQRFQKLN